MVEPVRDRVLHLLRQVQALRDEVEQGDVPGLPAEQYERDDLRRALSSAVGSLRGAAFIAGHREVEEDWDAGPAAPLDVVEDRTVEQLRADGDLPVVDITTAEQAAEHFDERHGMTTRTTVTGFMSIGTTRHYHAHLHRTGEHGHTHTAEALDPPVAGPPDPRTTNP